MILYFTGPHNQYVEADYAATSRAICKACSKKIQISTVKLGHIIEVPRVITKWYHFKCFELSPIFKDIDPEQQIYNLDKLESDDYDEVIKYIQNEQQRIKARVKRVKGASVIQKIQADQSKKQSEQDKDILQDKIQEGRKPSKKIKIQSAISFPQITMLTPQQQIKYQQLQDKYKQFSAQKLKKILSNNNQAKSGSKYQLVQRCADGQLLGKIPNCSHCGGGKLKFNRIQWNYKCPGYMDDDKFRHCNKKFSFEQVVRSPWTEFDS